jgi:hypothetical protein
MGPPSSNTLSVYKAKAFTRFARKAASLTQIYGTQLSRQPGSGRCRPRRRGLIKQRIARTGEGKSGGSRSIILFKKNDRAVYIYGFEKKHVANIDRRELEAFRELADVILGYTDAEIEQRVTDGALLRVEDPGDEDA